MLTPEEVARIEGDAAAAVYDRVTEATGGPPSMNPSRARDILAGYVQTLLSDRRELITERDALAARVKELESFLETDREVERQVLSDVAADTARRVEEMYAAQVAELRKALEVAEAALSDVGVCGLVYRDAFDDPYQRASEALRVVGEVLARERCREDRRRGEE